MRRPLVAKPIKRSGKEPTDVKVTADESEMKVKRGKVQNAEFSVVIYFS